MACCLALGLALALLRNVCQCLIGDIEGQSVAEVRSEGEFCGRRCRVVLDSEGI